MIESQRHSYHLVDPSPWPISGSLGALATTVGGVMYMHPFQGGATLLSLGLIFILYTMFVWWRDVLRESTLEGHHTKVVQLGPRYGSIPFIVSEVMFLFALFRASSHSSLAPTTVITMSEFAPIAISFVISLLVSLILLSICMMDKTHPFFSYIQSQTNSPLFHAELLSILISGIVSVILFGFGIPVIAYCADGDEQTKSPENEGIGAPQSREALPASPVAPSEPKEEESFVQGLKRFLELSDSSESEIERTKRARTEVGYSSQCPVAQKTGTEPSAPQLQSNAHQGEGMRPEAHEGISPEQLALSSRILEAHIHIGDLVAELRREEDMRGIGECKKERLAELFEKKYGGEHLLEIEQELVLNRRQSVYYSESKTLLNDLTRSGTTEKYLRDVWDGKGT